MDKDQIEAIKWRLSAASKEVKALCNGLSWRMRAPARETDSDVVISSSLNDIAALIADNERLAALLEDARRERDQLEAEVSVYRVTVLGVNVAAGQGED